MKIISIDDLKKNIVMGDLIAVAQRAYEMLYKGEATMPVRTITDFGGENPLVFYKPTYDNGRQEVVIKLLNQLKHTSDKGYPTIQGIVILVNGVTNQIQAIINGSYLTALRTGAASGLASKLLSREDSEILAVFGAGAQAYTQIQAVLAVRKIKKVIVFDLFDKAIERLINYFTPLLPEVSFVKGSSLDMLKEADIVCTVTNSKKKLFDTDMLKEGVHINAIGSFSKDMREMPDDVYTGASLFVDHKESCFSESGDIIVPLSQQLINDSNYKGEIAELILGKIKGRENAGQRTIFKSVGIATQDLTMAQFIYSKAVADNFGMEINL